MPVKQNILDLAVGQTIRDGDMDATVTRVVTPADGSQVSVNHGLQRKCRAVSLISKDAACDVFIVRDPQTSQYISDQERVTLAFTGNSVDVLVRCW